MEKILFLVTSGNSHVIVYARDRERAKRDAQRWLGNYNGGPDNYTVTPLTSQGDRVHLDLTLYA